MPEFNTYTEYTLSANDGAYVRKVFYDRRIDRGNTVLHKFYFIKNEEIYNFEFQDYRLTLWKNTVTVG
jgi:hypothetical protein